MTSMVLGKHGELTLPPEIRNRYGLKPDTPVRIVETQSGILVIPLTSEPASPQLAQELKDWQSVGETAWQAFGFEEEA